MILLKLFGSVVVAWLISAMGVAALGELIENKNTQDEFILVLLCIWVYMGYHGISWEVNFDIDIPRVSYTGNSSPTGDLLKKRIEI